MRIPTETKEKLLQTAIGLIWQSNYHRVGVNDICERAGVTKGSFYHYFDSKAELFVAASRYYWEAMKQTMDGIFSPSLPPLEQLERLIGFIIQKQQEMPQDGNPVSGCPFFTSGAQAGTGEEAVREAARAMADKGACYTVALARNLRAGGYLMGDASPEQTGRLLQQYVQGLLLYGRVYHDLGAVTRDLREGLYRLLEVRPEYRREGEEMTMIARASEPAL